MKKNILLLLVFLFSVSIWATHNRAGEITYKQTGSLSYEVTVTTYTKASSIPADRDSLEVYWGDGTSEFVVRSNGNGTLIGNNTKVNFYISTHNYPSLGTYTVSMTDPNRNGGILNVNPPNSDQVPFYLEAQFTILSSSFMGTNDSPKFLNPPIDIGYENQPFVHCPSHIDTDGDSLAYELVIPRQASGTPVTNYVFPEAVGTPFHFIQLDPVTGLFTWMEPRVAGEYVITILLKEYRNGTLIGQIYRDMQITILPMSNRPPTFTDTTLSYYELNVGQSVQFTLDANDLDNDNIQLTATGLPLLKNANFNAPTNNTNPTITGNFLWTPTAQDVRKNPYQMVFRVEDDAEGTYGGVFYKVVRIKVNFPVSTRKIENQPLIRLYPNPVPHQLNIDFDTPLSNNRTYHIFSNSGKLIQTGILSKGEQRLQVNTVHWTSGIYFFTIHQGEASITQQFVIVR